MSSSTIISILVDLKHNIWVDTVIGVNIVKSSSNNILGCTIDGRIILYNKSKAEIEEFYFDNGNADDRLSIETASLVMTDDGILWNRKWRFEPF